MKCFLLVLAVLPFALQKPTPVLCQMAQSKVMAQVQEPPELPPGEFCKRPEDVKTPQDHPCTCHRECVDDNSEGEDGTQQPGIRVKEDPQCKQYCHKEHCTCPLHGCP